MGINTVGILGGMGPAATAMLFNKIIDYTPAEKDQDHVNCVIINDPHVPDRTKYILGIGESPVPRLLNNLEKLYNAGADVALIPCMTAHSFIEDLEKSSPIPIINAIKLTDQYIKEKHPNVKKVGLLATTGSVLSGVYKKNLSIELVVPDEKNQRDLMNAIYDKNGIKAGNTTIESTNRVKKVINSMRQQDIQAVIAGCTEISLVINEDNVQMPVIDPLLLLAKEAVRITRQAFVHK